MDEQIIKIKTIMTEVSTGVARIQEMNDTYKVLYKEIASYCKEYSIKNTNPYSDLWEFYSYWSKKLPKYSDRRSYIIELYKKFGLGKEQKKNLRITTFYVNKDRIKEIQKIKSLSFDFKKLSKLCEEINILGIKIFQMYVHNMVKKVLKKYH
ncbi:MAG: hypothetical protein NTZ44_02765 [Candidatus Nomurabacteria bacterium]|nr:hypothetical protein [Candidatus Nomurabacteria bacterium]